MNAFTESIRKAYPPGKRIVLDKMGPDPRPVPPGTGGTVLEVDDIGTIHCRFDDGRILGIIPGEDEFHIEKTRTAERGEER